MGLTAGAGCQTACMEDMRRQRYALAGAIAVTVADLLRDVHPLTAEKEERVLASVARTHSSAAACSAVVARLLLAERDAARVLLGVLDTPQRAELGVTALEAGVRSTWAATIRVVAAAATELVATQISWAELHVEGSDEIRRGLSALAGYVEAVAELLQEHAPEGETGANV